MESIDFSVVIRTVGKAHEKYQKLLDSVDNLVPKPKEVIVVLPEGYDLPDEKLGYERFCYSKKGMYYQRLKGIEECKTKYALLCDDDVAFDSDFVQKLYKPLEMHLGGISAGPLYSFLPPVGFNAFISVFISGACPTIFHRDRYVTMLKNTSYSYNRHLKTDKTVYYESQSVSGTCFFADLDELKKCDIEAEVWCDENGFASSEDGVLVYKAWLCGCKTIVVSNAFFVHNDGKTSSSKNNTGTKFYCKVFNKYVFWYRFVYRQQSNIFSKLCAVLAWKYYRFCTFLQDRFNLLRKRITKYDIEVMKKAYSDAQKFVKSQDYKDFIADKR